MGSAVIRHILTNTDDQVINLDKLTYAGNLQSLSDVSGSNSYAFEQVDICDRAGLGVCAVEVFETALQDHPASSSRLISEGGLE